MYQYIPIASARTRRAGFTLIELLVVIAIIAILAVVVVLTLNPAQLLAQSRDANRVSDMATLNSAIGLYQTDQSGLGSMGSSSTVYPSIFDASAATIAGTDCSTIGLPVLPTGYGYHCAASTTFRNATSFGWIPLNFQSVSAGAPFGTLPVDPINQSSSRLYYTYTTNGGQFEITAPMESSKYKLGGSNDVISSDGSSLSSVYAKGTNLALEPLDYGDSSIVGYWPMDEGVGLTAIDASGNGNAGTWHGSASGTNGYYSAGKVGPYTGYFNGSNDYVGFAITATPNTYTVLGWIKPASFPGLVNDFAVAITPDATHYYFAMQPYTGGEVAVMAFQSATTFVNTSGAGMAVNNWYHVAATATVNGPVNIYVNGVLKGSGTAGSVAAAPAALTFGDMRPARGINYSGALDDVRIYNRALSAAEIQALYNAEK